MTECPDCKLPCKGTRGVSVHQHRGCPAVIAEMFSDGYSMEELAAIFAKTESRIEQIIRVEGIKHRRTEG